MTGLAVGALLFLAADASAGKCVQIYYDSVPRVSPRYAFGRVHALFLQNLLGHFPDVEQRVIPIEKYEKGQLDRCAASFYLGTYFDNAAPAAFLADFSASTRAVVWAGYNVWELGPEALERTWGARFRGLSTLDASVKDALGRPTFFKLFDYKGRTFEKYGEEDAQVPGRFNAAFEISLFDLVSTEAARGVPAWARHNGRPELRSPYVLRSGNKWYVADSPFSFITEEDRYLIFCDLLFDMLDEKPRRPPGAKKPALFRVEDVNPTTPSWQLYAMADMLAREKVPFSVAVIPMWVDSLGITKAPRKYALAAARPGFVDFLKYAAARRASFILHGVTHEYGFSRNPFTGITGDDFEFWDRRANRPVDKDSEGWVVARLKDGLDLLGEAGVEPSAWMTPHYQASALDYGVFARFFDWNVGRVIYFPPGAPEGTLPSGQFFPYEVFGDVYGQRLVPEDAGNVQPYMNEQVLKSVTIDDMIATMRRDAVIRDAWASFFVHPSMLDTVAKGGTARRPGDAAQIERLVRAAKENGYEFVDLAAWTRANRRPTRPEPVETPP